MAISGDDITGAVLAGGRGLRMGGVNKGLQPFRGMPLVIHALTRLAPQVGPVLINANQDVATYEALGYPVVPDQDGDYNGPLSGVLSALEHTETEWLATVPCDSPFFPSDLVAHMAQHAWHQQAEVAVASTPTGWQPVFMLIRRTATQSLRDFLSQGGRKIDQWIRTRPHAAVPFDDEAAFANLNTVDELNGLQHARD